MDELRSSDPACKSAGGKTLYSGTILKKAAKTPTGKFELYSERDPSHRDST